MMRCQALQAEALACLSATVPGRQWAMLSTLGSDALPERARFRASGQYHF
jgi:hypothetical protein